ncbi:hypothetical protein BD410DRAFT_804515 [Rickenella mellea]|uniref:Uncharacterized protein n=1 Tax=Rickenella mellea TaxID=50990 RepID=A0A4Y7Q1H7_9AGAM|nr:hypothetical protein BD410DRAFT_804515 [Rickenella mellea]
MWRRMERNVTHQARLKGIRYEDIHACDSPERDKEHIFKDEDVDVNAFVGQSHRIAFYEQEDLDSHQDPGQDEDGEDKDTLTRSWLARTFTAHRPEGASLPSANGRNLLEIPQLSRDPTLPTPTPAQAKKPTMTLAPTVFSSTASSYDYEFDGDEEVFDSARLFTSRDYGDGGVGRTRGLLEKLKRWTGAYSYTVEHNIGNEGGVRVDGRGRGRTPELESRILYEPPSHPSRIR